MAHTPIPIYSGVTPQRTQSPDEFSKNANDWLDYQAPLAKSYNTLAGQIDAMANKASTSEANAATSKTSADNSATRAANSATKAAQTADNMTAAAMSNISGGMVVSRLDAHGNQNVMVKIPMFTNKIVNDVLGTSWQPGTDPHPAFIRPDGTTMPWFEVGMYMASQGDKYNPVSAPHKDPYTSNDFDKSKEKCQSMGTGWGLMTNAQWAAITIWCLMNEYQPTGNTNFGQSHTKKFQTAIRQDGKLIGEASGSGRTLTGSGPKEWNHNNASIGIADLVGNSWEWVDGFKIVDGKIIVAENSEPDEKKWISQAAFLDNGMKLNSTRTDTTNTGDSWSSLGKTSKYVENQLLQQLMIEPISETNAALGRLYYNNDGERMPLRGSAWYDGYISGLGSMMISYPRSKAAAEFGFRPAYFE